ncbi:MBL fold metallo-hydrolase [bacterium]|nr:MBL fold metallo-hydrolase [bacterium]
MQQVTPTVYTDTTIRGCNPSFVVTSDGVVVIDTPQLPTKAVEMRKIAESHGPIRYLINTEHHVDHIFGNYYFKGDFPVIAHKGVDDNFMVVGTDLDPFEYAKEAIPMDDPDGAAIFPERDVYEADMNRPEIVFTGDVELRVGDTVFEVHHTPGHTPGQVTVYVPSQKVVFTGDTIFSECQTWLHTSDIDQWLTALEKIRTFDFDYICPGHGPVTTKQYLDVQRANLMDWVTAVADAVAKGWTREEVVEQINFRDRYPVDVGQGYMMNHIQTNNAGSLYDKLTVGH